jgi:hypothetical protein
MHTKFYTLSLLLLFNLCLTSFGQETNLVLDGSLGETIWKNEKSILQTHEVYISEDKENYYVGVKTKSNSIVNLLVFNGQRIRVFHSSLSIGHADYHFNKENRANIIKGFSEADSSWIYRDASVRKSENQKKLAECYALYGWVASPINLGNVGEIEFMIGKSLIEKGSSICVLYDNNWQLKTYPENATITPSKKTDFALHMGNTPTVLNINPLNWFVLNSN